MADFHAARTSASVAPSSMTRTSYQLGVTVAVVVIGPPLSPE